MGIDFDYFFEKYKDIYSRDGFDFSDKPYSKDLYKILYFIYTYGKGYLYNIDEWYLGEFELDITNEDYEYFNNIDFCLDALRLIHKGVQASEMIEHHFSSQIIEIILDQDKVHVSDYTNVRNILIAEDLIPALDIKQLDEEFENKRLEYNIPIAD